MTNKSETPAGSHVAGVSWKSLDCSSTISLTPTAHRAQHINSKYELRLKRGTMLRTLARGGQDHDV